MVKSVERITLAVLASASLIVGCLHAAPVYDALPSGAMVWFDMVFKGGKPGGGDLRVLVQIVGDKPTVVAFGGDAVRYRQYDGITLTYSGSKLSGTQRVFEGESVDYGMQVDVTATSGVLSGTYTLQRSRGVTDDGVAATGLGDLKGQVTGSARTEASLGSVNAMSSQFVWDSYVGPTQNFSSAKSGVTLIDKPEDAKLVWVSQFIGGMQIGDCRHGWRLAGPTVGGAATPLIYRGKVYQFYHQPTGDKIQKCFADAVSPEVAPYAQLMGLDLNLVKRRFAYIADEYLACIDAATGKTVWRTKWAEEGLNFVGHKTAFTNQTGCVGDGRVYAFGTKGILRAVDAESGKELWAKPIPGYFAAMKSLADKWIAGGISEPVSRSYAHGLNYAGGVVVCPTGTGECALVGLDGATGDSLWRAGGLGSKATPLRWVKDGKEYVISVNGSSATSGSIYCIEPKTGKVLWTQSGAGDNEFPFALEGDYLLCDGGMYRLSLTGAQKLWSADCTHGSKGIGIIYEGIAWLRCDSKTWARELTTGKTLVEDASLAHTAEQMTFATEGYIYMNKEAQHNASHNFQLYKNDPANWKQLGSTWRPPHPIDLTYAIPVMYPTANGRLFMRGGDGIYCYDIRKGTPAVSTDTRINGSAPRLHKDAARQTSAARFDIRGRHMTGPGSAGIVVLWGAGMAKLAYARQTVYRPELTATAPGRGRHCLR